MSTRNPLGPQRPDRQRNKLLVSSPDLPGIPSVRPSVANVIRSPRQPRYRPSLLGSYPVLGSHPAGLPRPAGARDPRYAPQPQPPQYGIDYSFLRWAHGKPVRWQPRSPVDVRLTGPSVIDAHAAVLLEVIEELAMITGLKLRFARGTSGLADLCRVPDGQIWVTYVSAADLNPSRFAATHLGRPDYADCAGSGGAMAGADPGYFRRGIALINRDVGGADPASPEAMKTLRHELGHALGLGHAARMGQVMHDHISGRVTRYGHGDRHGLATLGQPTTARSLDTGSGMERTLLCAV